MMKVSKRIFNLETETAFTVLAKANKLKLEGKDIINFSRGDLSSSSTRKASKKIMRQALDFHLGAKKIKIREYLSLKEQRR